MEFNVFIDTDVVIDYFTDREPFYNPSSELFELNQKGFINLYISAVSINNIYYITRRFLGHQKTINVLKSLIDMVEIVGTSKKEIEEALISNFSDFEDSIQYSSARNINSLDAIITRNVKDYKNSEISVLTPLDFLKLVQKNNE